VIPSWAGTFLFTRYDQFLDMAENDDSPDTQGTDDQHDGIVAKIKSLFNRD
jgi:hypothetical protein